MLLEPHAPRDARFATPVLCEFDGDGAPALGAIAPAHLMVSNSVEYLFRHQHETQKSVSESSQRFRNTYFVYP